MNYEHRLYNHLWPSLWCSKPGTRSILALVSHKDSSRSDVKIDPSPVRYKSQKNKCYSCHVGYGINGNLEAKIDGLQHMGGFLYRFYTGTFQEPIKLFRPYNNSNCLRCHAGAKKFERNSSHVAIMRSLKTNKASCLLCHAEAHFEPAANLRE